MAWRIYRLPGSREVWHIDNGPDTQIFNVYGIFSHAPVKTVDVGGQDVPRAWLEISPNAEMHIVNNKAIFDYPVEVALGEVVQEIRGEGAQQQ